MVQVGRLLRLYCLCVKYVDFRDQEVYIKSSHMLWNSLLWVGQYILPPFYIILVTDSDIFPYNMSHLIASIMRLVTDSDIFPYNMSHSITSIMRRRKYFAPQCEIWSATITYFRFLSQLPAAYCNIEHINSTRCLSQTKHRI